MKIFILLAGLLLQGIAMAQSSEQPPLVLNYDYVELRFVDVDSNGGDGIRVNGSYNLGNNWLVVGGLTSLDFNGNVDTTTWELGAGYVWDYSNDFDLLSSLRYVRAEADTPIGNADDNGFAFSAGARGLLTPEFEIRGSVNHVNFDNSDTYLELAGDYHFSRQFAAGLSVEFAGDTDIITVGARWFFR
ncbi:MAG: porin family protein [Gammaproteobacteria bacterium]|nr:porin family protein [Gammaproteobacteria bacterium]